jgi:succinate-semialdehyde dehydrogenase/glutarate-semialdehyde dehydrogenase
MIVRADADLDYASSGAVWGAFTNAGQACLSVERVYVVREVAEEFTRLSVEKTKNLRVGPGDDPSTDVGPLIRDRQVSVVEEHVRDAVRQGAQVRTGGRRLKGPGFFYEPTVLTGAHHGMQIMREETFGPVLAIMTVQDDREAVALANDSHLGLSASIWTRDRRQGELLAAQLQAGAVMINDCASYFGISEAPHGGVKQSGIGRTHSRLGLMEMVRVKYIDADLAAGFRKFWWFEYGPKALDLMRGFVDFLFARNLAGRVRGLSGVLVNLWKRGREGQGARIRPQVKKSSDSES